MHLLETRVNEANQLQDKAYHYESQVHQLNSKMQQFEFELQQTEDLRQ